MSLLLLEYKRQWERAARAAHLYPRTSGRANMRSSCCALRGASFPSAFHLMGVVKVPKRSDLGTIKPPSN